MMKYKLFRSPGDLDKAVRKHELVAVETGKNIDDVADALIRAVREFFWIFRRRGHFGVTAATFRRPQGQSRAEHRRPHPGHSAPRQAPAGRR